MIAGFKQLDRILRGEATRLSSLTRGSIDVTAGGLFLVIFLLGALNGACMGCFALIRTWNGPNHHDGLMQMLASMGKVPALFLLTLVVTFPSLYVFNALVGSRLTILSLLRLIVAAMSVMLAVLASFGTIVAFFSFTTTSYPFMLLLNVVVFAISGVLGVVFLLQTLRRLASIIRAEDMGVMNVGAAGQPAGLDPRSDQAPAGAEEYAPHDSVRSTVQPPPIPGALDAMEGRILGSNVKAVFRIWMIVFATVGAQMSWVLRPFIGNPNQPFTLFRPRQSSFFEGVVHALTQLIGRW